MNYLKDLHWIWTHPKNRYHYLLQLGDLEFDRSLKFGADNLEFVVTHIYKILGFIVILALLENELITYYFLLCSKLLLFYNSFNLFYLLKSGFFFSRSLYLTVKLMEMEKDAIRAHK